jgi:tetratricopeptide (TPR) repeat protein
VTATTVDSVTFKYTLPSGPTATMRLKANQLDPYSFYTVRKAHMEQTVENHLALAKFCMNNDLFARAQIQIGKARALDPEKVKEIGDDPEVQEAIGQKLLTYIAQELKAGNMEEAEKWIAILLTKLPETKAAETARENLDKVDEAREAKQAREAADRDAVIEAQADEAKKKAAREKAAQLAPIYKHIDAGEKMYSASLRQKSSSQNQKGLEQAGMHFESAIKQIDALRKRIGDNPELDQLEAESKADAIKCYIGAGNVDLSRGSFNQADRWARRALSVDPDSAAAKDFQTRVVTASSMSGGFGWGGRR